MAGEEQAFGAVASVAIALISSALASGDVAKARAIREDIARRIGAHQLPKLDRLVAQTLPPESLAAYQKVTQPMQAQSDVLDKWMAEVNAKGETPEDRAAYLRMQNESDSIASGTMSRVQRQMQQRGLEGSGMSFALQQAGAQAGANRANATGIEAASAARGRYADALRHAGAQAGQMRGQDLEALGAADRINEFNARARSDAAQYNAGLAQQEFDNEMTKSQAEANAQLGIAGDYERSATNTKQTGAGIANSANTLGQYERKKDKK